MNWRFTHLRLNKLYIAAMHIHEVCFLVCA
jgi:hypothetical protein